MKVFQLVKEIRSREGVLHFKRYAIFETEKLSLYLHRIYKEDQDFHLHSHPWNFINIILWGTYLALDEDGLNKKSPGTVSQMDKTQFHKIHEIVDGPITTLLLAYGKREPWYYLVDGEKVESQEYRRIKNRNR